MLISLWILINDKPFNLFWHIVFLKYVFNLLKTETDLSHSQNVTGIVHNTLSAAVIFGNDFFIGKIAFKVVGTDVGTFTASPKSIDAILLLNQFMIKLFLILKSKKNHNKNIIEK